MDSTSKAWFINVEDKTTKNDGHATSEGYKEMKLSQESRESQ